MSITETNPLPQRAASAPLVPPEASVPLTPALIDLAATNLADVITLALEHRAPHRALVVFDQRCALAQALTAGYRRCLPGAHLIDFDTVDAQQIQAEFASLAPGDLVVLVQSSNFRLDAYRIRVELFKLGLKVIEHPHLARMPGIESAHYIAALAYDRAYYHGTGHALKARIDRAQSALLDSDGAQLEFGPLEPAKLNIGDYTGMTNIGGQFPIGEVFTEARTLENVKGRVRIFVFGDTAFAVNQPLHPITLIIECGRVTATEHSTPEFDQVLQNIRADEGQVWLRELGFGLNRALGPHHTVSDIGTFERMCGVHLSLGAKHGVYQKPGFKRGVVRHHVDVFPVTKAVFLDGENVYRDGAWRV